MEFPLKFDTVKSGWSIVYIEGSQVIGRIIRPCIKMDNTLDYYKVYYIYYNGIKRKVIIGMNFIFVDFIINQ